MILEKLGARQAAAPAGGGRGNFNTVRGEKATRGRGYRTQTRGPSTTFGLRHTSLLMNNFDAACSASYAVCGKGINWYPNLATLRRRLLSRCLRWRCSSAAKMLSS